MLRQERTTPFFYGWVIVAVCFTSLALTFGIKHSYAVFLVALIDEFHWSRASVAGVILLGNVIFALGSPLVGAILDRFGPQKTFSGGAMLFALGLIACSTLQYLWQIYLFYGVIAFIGFTVLGLTPHVALVSRWFIRKRGAAVGIACAGSGVGILAIAPLSEVLISTIGWRQAYIVLATLFIVITLPAVALLLRRDPSRMASLPDGVTTSSSDPQPNGGGLGTSTSGHISVHHGWTIKAALGTSRFWFLFTASVLGVAPLTLMLVHQVAWCVDIGYSRSFAAFIFGLVGLLMAIGYIVWGYASDRLGREAAYSLGTVAVLLSALITLVLRDASQSWPLYVYALFFGLGFGSRISLLSSMAADVFAGPYLATINGLLGSAYGLGAGIGAWFGGYVFDISGSYLSAFAIGTAATALSGLFAWLGQPRGVRHKELEVVQLPSL
ncbi:MAG: MFS transporter [Chloroflexi bacterium]|nr:MFS transporter [Chloroflexota bacterium]MCL5074095.1 MFS transporter [Chloroflexota bacterium]